MLSYDHNNSSMSDHFPGVFENVDILLESLRHGR